MPEEKKRKVNVEKNGFNAVVGDPEDDAYTITTHVPKEWSLRRAAELTLQIEALFNIHKERENQADE